MLRVLFYAIPIVLAIYTIVDCLQTPARDVRGLPRLAWIVLILFFPVLGSVTWLLAGRARGGAANPRISWPAGATDSPAGQPRATRRVVAPDDDPEFLSQLGRRNSSRGSREHDALLEQWERDLRGHGDDATPAPGDGPTDDPGPGPDTGGGASPRT